MSENIIDSAPVDWGLVTLGDLCRLGGGDIQTGPFGSQLHASDYVPIGIPSVMPQNIGDNVIWEEDIARITPEDAKRLGRYRLAAGDIVYSRRGDVERRALVRTEHSGWLCGTGCLRVRPGNAVNSRFLSYYLGHPDVRAWIVRHAIGATMPNLNTQILSALPVRLPPRKVQAHVAALLGILDDKIAVNDRITRTALELAESSYLRASQTNSTDTHFPLSEVAEVVMGQSPPGATCNRTGIGLPLLNGPTEFGSVFPVPAQWTTAPTRTCRAGDILICVRGSTTGKLNRADREYVLGRGIAAIRARLSRQDTECIYVAIRQRLADLLQRTTGSVFPNLSRNDLESFLIPWPEQGQQSSVSELLYSLVNLAGGCERANQVLAELRDTLLPRLISGELRSRDAEKVVEDVV
jgi:type I restriction enzyme S subunit